MHKETPDFADDLSGIQQDVATDVGRILELANSTRREPERGAVGVPLSSQVEQDPPAPRRAARAQKRTPTQSHLAAERVALVNVTTRLTHETNEVLTEAALRQRLKKCSPASRQDIIEVALREWLKRNEYSF